MNTLVIIGAGGHGRVVADCAQQVNTYKEIIFLDDSYKETVTSGDWKIVGLSEDFHQHIGHADFIVGIGNNLIRAKITKKLLQANANVVSLIHPTASISPKVSVDNGVVIFANAVVNIGSHISEGCIINTGATVDHDCKLKPYVHVSPGVNIAGGVTIEQYSWLGIGSAVIEYLTVAKNTQIGAGAVVINSTQANSLYLGVPAQKVRTLTTNLQDL